jgi:hypothetical protein
VRFERSAPGGPAVLRDGLRPLRQSRPALPCVAPQPSATAVPQPNSTAPRVGVQRADGEGFFMSGGASGEDRSACAAVLQAALTPTSVLRPTLPSIAPFPS